MKVEPQELLLIETAANNLVNWRVGQLNRIEWGTQETWARQSIIGILSELSNDEAVKLEAAMFHIKPAQQGQNELLEKGAKLFGKTVHTIGNEPPRDLDEKDEAA